MDSSCEYHNSILSICPLIRGKDSGIPSTPLIVSMSHSTEYLYLSSSNTSLNGHIYFAGEICDLETDYAHPYIISVSPDFSSITTKTIDSIYSYRLMGTVGINGGLLALYDYSGIQHIITIMDNGEAQSIRSSSSFPRGGEILDLTISEDNAIVGCGYVQYRGSGSDCYYFKMNTNGKIVWKYTKGSYSEDYFKRVFCTSDGGFLFVGNVESEGTDRGSILLLKTDANGRY